MIVFFTKKQREYKEEILEQLKNVTKNLKALDNQMDKFSRSVDEKCDRIGANLDESKQMLEKMNEDLEPRKGES
jgi:peptidoglycan hydrolase CwlO-like protein